MLLCWEVFNATTTYIRRGSNLNGRFKLAEIILFSRYLSGILKTKNKFLILRNRDDRICNIF
ncbi:unnamed protein product [Meloidogyne enterolobii]|uniref:Uncharacterized protein n=1 Tax=Meloidogyne enterolobii TaxID=390850 RepID=A0ACB0YCW8_MELEN